MPEHSLLNRRLYSRLTGLGLIVACLFLTVGSVSPAAASCKASTSGGGLSVKANKCKPFKKARLIRGKAIAPASAPARVKRVIAWANKIRNKPYQWGGGHASFFSRGYDCSGAISFALRGGGMIRSPLSSSGFYGWGRSGKGKWITVYTNPSHAYIVVAGLRFDTANTPGSGPRWSKSLRSTSGRFTARYPAGF